MTQATWYRAKAGCSGDGRPCGAVYAPRTPALDVHLSDIRTFTTLVDKRVEMIETLLPESAVTVVNQDGGVEPVVGPFRYRRIVHALATGEAEPYAGELTVYSPSNRALAS